MSLEVSNIEAQTHLCPYPDEIVHVVAELREDVRMLDVLWFLPLCSLSFGMALGCSGHLKSGAQLVLLDMEEELQL